MDYTDENTVSPAADTPPQSLEPNHTEELAQNACQASVSSQADQAAEARHAELENKYLRLVAEFDNYKKRTNKEMVALTQTAGKAVILSMLEVLDDMQRAVNQLPSQNADELREGFRLVFDKFHKQFKQLGVEAIEAIHTEFNTDLHEALTEVPVDDPEQKNKVIDVVQEGYLLNGQLIRFAKVVVGK